MKDTVKRNLVNYVIMVVLVAGAYFAGHAQYEHERHARIARDNATLERTREVEHKLKVTACHDRVKGREAVRSIVVEAYTPPAGTPADRVQEIAMRRDDVLAKVPPLHCINTEAVPVK